MNSTARKILIVAAVAFALGAPALQAILGFGLSPAEFSRQGDGTLRAAGYAFSIWSVIYVGLVAYAVWQALPRNDASPVIGALALPSAVAIAGCGAWILASAFDARWLTVAIIVGSAAVLTAGLVRAARRGGKPTIAEQAFVWWPLGLLAGWLTIASAVNILTVLTAERLIGDMAKVGAVAGVAAVLAAALIGLRAMRLAAYGVAIAWGLVAVWVAEKAGKPDVAAVALGAAVLVAGYAAWQARPRATAA